jgi:hypothetical protein
MTEIKCNKEDIDEFIDLLLQLAQNERLMDINRCLLSQDLYFDISSLYNYIFFKFSEEKNIDNNIITFSTLKKFISDDLDIQINDEILGKIFDFYSKPNYFGRERYLEYIEFIDIFYPRYNLNLRKYLQSRNGLNKDIKELNSITKMLLQKLFVRQINFVKYLFHYNDKVKIDCKNLFKIISKEKIFITKGDLINLFNKESIYFTEEDINSIMASLSYINRHFYSNKKISNIEEGIYYKSFENIFNIQKKVFSIKPLTNNDKISIIKSIILNSIYQEKKVEEAKSLIVNRDDFNINILLNLFTNENNEEKIEFNTFIKKMKLNLDEIEYELLLRRIDLLRKRFLYKSDLFDFFIPFDKDIRNKIKNDFENNRNINKDINSKNCFSKGTMIFINNLINVVIKGEKEINMKKIKLNNDEEFIENIFNEICDMPKNENEINSEIKIFDKYFTAGQLFKYLKDKLNVELPEKELILFFIRLDKFRRGRIEFLEFSDEMKYIQLKYS